MKKLLLLMAIAISGLTASADTAVFYAGSATHPTGTNEYQLSGNVAGNTYDCGNVSLKFIKNNTSGASNVNSNLVRFYKGDEIVITGIEGSEINITKVIVEAGSANYAVMTVTDPQNEKFSTSNTTQTWASENGVSSITLSNTAQARFSYIEVTYTLSAADDRQPAGLAFAEEAYTANLGEDFTAPELTKPNGLEVTYKSSNEAVATVATDGNVTILTAGTTTITATSEETEVFKAGEASYKLTVIDPNSTEDKIVFESLGYSDGTALTTVTKGKSTLTFAKGSNSNNAPKYYVSDKTARLYSGNTLTIAVDESCYITEIVFGGSTLGALTASAGSYNNKTWTPTVARSDNKISNVTFTATGKPKFSSITVKYALIPSGIADIEAEENGVVEYFNLQGVRVDEPANGLYIRRAGNKVEKVIVR